jgi:hypothetical protein
MTSELFLAMVSAFEMAHASPADVFEKQLRCLEAHKLTTLLEEIGSYSVAISPWLRLMLY